MCTYLDNVCNQTVQNQQQQKVPHLARNIFNGLRLDVCANRQRKWGQGVPKVLISVQRKGY